MKGGLNEAVSDDKYSMINFEETELRLGLPGAAESAHKTTSTTWCGGGKRGFSDDDTSVDLKLNLSSTTTTPVTHNTTTTAASPSNDPSKPPAKYVKFKFPSSTLSFPSFF